MPVWCWLNSQSSSSQRNLALLAQQVRRLLLKKSSTTKIPASSLAEIRDYSQIEGAGRGVWSKTFIPKHCAFCLYPGVYTPGLPLHTTVLTASAADDSGVNVAYLGKSTTPSTRDFDENAYILNVQLSTGGYIDGLALEYTTAGNGNGEKKMILHRLDENPNACGHCINHSTTRANAKVIKLTIQDNESSISKKDIVDDDQCYYSIPNIVRADKSPWYAVIGEKYHHHDKSNDDNGDGIVRFTGNGKCCGAVFCAIRDINPEEEILFDFALFPPLPSWAKDWYDASQ
jgi:hypothetical protein